VKPYETYLQFVIQQKLATCASWVPLSLNGRARGTSVQKAQARSQPQRASPRSQLIRGAGSSPLSRRRRERPGSGHEAAASVLASTQRACAEGPSADRSRLRRPRTKPWSAAETDPVSASRYTERSLGGDDSPRRDLGGAPSTESWGAEVGKVRPGGGDPGGSLSEAGSPQCLLCGPSQPSSAGCRKPAG